MHQESSEWESRQCPFCSSSDDCRHVLLCVDKTFGTADSGPLKTAFNERWYEFRAEQGGDFDEREPFERLLEEVECFADATAEYDHEGGPGMSSTYVVYYVKSEEKARTALSRFTSGG